MVEVVAGRSDPAAVEQLLRSLPDWFGIEESIVDYVRDAHTKPTYLALDDEGAVIGAVLLTRHNPQTAEIHLMAVAPARHRQGIGTVLLRRLEHDLRADGVRLLEVKTVGPSMEYEPYERTRGFYTAKGFIPVEEVDGLWPGNPCLILVKPLVSEGAR